MKTIQVSGSSTITRIDYLEEEKQLYITFKSGGKYLYNNVDKLLFEQFEHSNSKGKWLHNFKQTNSGVKVQ